MTILSESIKNLDLDSVIMRMKRDEGLSTEEIQQAITEYRQFLELNLNNSEKVVPTEMADKAWHYHILDTKKYIADCEVLFGELLNHDPNSSNTAEFDEAIKRTHKQWKETFGKDAPKVMTSSMCGS